MLGQPEINVLPFNYYLVNGSGRSLQLHPGRSYVMGREKSCDIRIVDTLLSREHCRLDWDPETQWSIVDLDSRNGTFVNDAHVSHRRRLKDRDRIRLGGQVLTLYYVQLGHKADDLATQSSSYRSEATLDLADAYQRHKDDGCALAGSLRITALPSLLQLFKNNRTSGRIIFDKSEERSLWLLNGKPLHAIFDAHAGPEAMMGLFEFCQHFAFYPDQVKPVTGPGNLDSNDGLVIDQHTPNHSVQDTHTISNNTGTEELPRTDRL